MNAAEFDWLIGSQGIWSRDPGGQIPDGQSPGDQTPGDQPSEGLDGWARIGAGAFAVSAVQRAPDGLLVATEGGLWQIPTGTDQWIQWHDESLTLVHDLCAVPVGIGVAVASAYGVATATLDELGTPRWRWQLDDQSPDGRYTNALIADPTAPHRWLAATEAGVLLTEDSGQTWSSTSLSGVPARSLLCADGTYWAGADHGGIWKSTDGSSWSPAGSGLEETPVYSLAQCSTGILAGTDRGVAHGGGTGEWHLSGAPLRVAAVAVHEGCWAAGATPGGLWFSADEGETWRKDGHFQHVRVIAPPEIE